MKKKVPRNYHHGDLRGALVRAGRDILEAGGMAALTLRACARKAGVSHAAPQHHFATVADLLGEIAASGFEDFVRTLDEQAGPETKPAARLTAMGRAYVGFAAARPAIYQLMFGAKVPQRPARLQDAMTAAWIQLEAAVKAVAGPDDVDAKATQVWSLVHGFSMLTIAGRLPPNVDARHALDLLAENLPRAIGA
ncbi:MAG: WHG domain-containing protein [Aestuariivirga sp.]